MSQNLKELLQRDLTAAVRASDDARKRTLRVVMAVIHSAEARDATVENPVARDLSDDEILSILGTEADRRRRAIAAYENAGHGHRATAERDELTILTTYLHPTEDVLSSLPDWYWAIPYVSGRYPGAPGVAGMEEGANCQVFAYAVVAHFGLRVPPLRSSDLWDDTDATIQVTDLQPLDLLLFNSGAQAYGAHVGVYVGPGRILHLCKEVGLPAVWSADDFAGRSRYSMFVGAKRVLPTDSLHRRSTN